MPGHAGTPRATAPDANCGPCGARAATEPTSPGPASHARVQLARRAPVPSAASRASARPAPLGGGTTADHRSARPPRSDSARATRGAAADADQPADGAVGARPGRAGSARRRRTPPRRRRGPDRSRPHIVATAPTAADVRSDGLAAEPGQQPGLRRGGRRDVERRVEQRPGRRPPGSCSAKTSAAVTSSPSSSVSPPVAWREVPGVDGRGRRSSPGCTRVAGVGPRVEVHGAHQGVVLGEGGQRAVRGRLPAGERVVAQQVVGVLGEAARRSGRTAHRPAAAAPTAARSPGARRGRRRSSRAATRRPTGPARRRPPGR